MTKVRANPAKRTGKRTLLTTNRRQRIRHRAICKDAIAGGGNVWFIHIVPKIYGKNLRLSTLTVLLGLLAGVLLAGIPGSMAALPIIASYAAIERIWLKQFLRDGVSEKHTSQMDEAFGEQD